MESIPRWKADSFLSKRTGRFIIQNGERESLFFNTAVVHYMKYTLNKMYGILNSTNGIFVSLCSYNVL